MHTWCTLGTRGLFSRAMTSFVDHRPTRLRPKIRAAKPREKHGFSRGSLFKTWPKPETGHKKPLEPRVYLVWWQWTSTDASVILSGSVERKCVLRCVRTGDKKRATCFATLLQNELNSDVARFTTHIKPVLQQIRYSTCFTSNVAKQVTRFFIHTLFISNWFEHFTKFS